MRNQSWVNKWSSWFLYSLWSWKWLHKQLCSVEAATMPFIFWWQAKVEKDLKSHGGAEKQEADRAKEIMYVSKCKARRRRRYSCACDNMEIHVNTILSDNHQNILKTLKWFKLDWNIAGTFQPDFFKESNNTCLFFSEGNKQWNNLK